MGGLGRDMAFRPLADCSNSLLYAVEFGQACYDIGNKYTVYINLVKIVFSKYEKMDP